LSFLEIQTLTGWGRVLRSFADWCQPQAGWLALDVGCGPGLLPALLEQRGCQACGVDLDLPAPQNRLHAGLAQADALSLPFPGQTFDLVTASNLLFFLPDPLGALVEIRRVLRPGGYAATLNPSERMSVAAATALADQHGLQGLARDSLVDWARRAEANHRWGEAELLALFAAARMNVTGMELKVGPGLARFVKGIK
jgi:SAM-dependent methyltransferase